MRPSTKSVLFSYTMFCNFQVESFEINPDLDEEARTCIATSKFLLSPDPEEPDSAVDPETQARLEALLEAAGKLALFKMSS